ncbi:hypothetical protein HanIR_Chr04g0173891 [Helianthus annuus]|nr:hypothetical protein HanIR_Chr04g0173891 [Helianthus annuus]
MTKTTRVLMGPVISWFFLCTGIEFRGMRWMKMKTVNRGCRIFMFSGELRWCYGG